MKCDHNYCRCARAAELAAMGQLEEAVKLHQLDELVTCRLEQENNEQQAQIQLQAS